MTNAANPFIVTPSEAHRGPYVDCKALAVALAAKWGAEVGECEEGAYGMGRVIIDRKLTLYIRADSRKLGRVEVGASCPFIERKLSHYDRASFPRVSADTGKGLEKLAADLSRRVIGLSWEPLAKLEEKYSAQIGHRAALKAHAETLRAALPFLRIDVSEDETKLDANLYGNSDGVYFSGRLSSSGSISFDRVGSVDAAKGLAVLSALFAER